MKIRFVILMVVVLLALTAASMVQAQRPEPEKTEIKGHTMYTLLKPGDIPPIMEPQFMSVTEAESLYYPDEPLIVVTSGDETHGYSTWHLDHHEIVNDYINGKSITVTW